MYLWRCAPWEDSDKPAHLCSRIRILTGCIWDHADNDDSDQTARMHRLILSLYSVHIRRYIFSHCRPNVLFNWNVQWAELLTLVLLNPDIPCLCKQSCLSLNMWIYINSLDQVNWLVENWKWMWHLNLFSMTRVNALNFESQITR